MPLYNLRCPKCGSEYEDVMATIKEYEDGVKCEKCGHGKLENKMSAKPIQFNCPGFYCTDYTDYNQLRNWPHKPKREVISDGTKRRG